MSTRSGHACVLAVLAALMVGARSDQSLHSAEAGDVLVKFRRTLAPLEHAEVDRLVAADWSSAIGSTGVRRLRSARHDLQTLLVLLRSHPDVEYAEPNYVVRADRIPN